MFCISGGKWRRRNVTRLVNCHYIDCSYAQNIDPQLVQSNFLKYIIRTRISCYLKTNPFFDGLIISNRNSPQFSSLRHSKQANVLMTRQTMRKVINYSVCSIIWISYYRLSYTVEMPISFWWVWFSHICDCLIIQISQT